MAAPKGHPNYNYKPEACKEGGKFGYLGCPDHYFTDEELKKLGKGVVQWISEKGNIWMKYYFSMEGVHWNTVEKLRARSQMFSDYLDMAKQIQESKLISEPYYKKADANHARFILARHHKQEWEDKPTVEQETLEEMKTNLAKIAEMAKTGELSQK